MLRKSLISTRSKNHMNATSMAFNGTDEYILTGFKPEVSAGASLVMWVKMRDFTGEQTMGCGSSERFYLGFNGTNIAFGIQDTSKSSTDVSSYVNVNQWHHLVLTADGGTAKVYIDGVQRDTASYTEDASSNPVDGFVIGARNSSDAADERNQSPMNCLINEVAIYCKDLTVSDINRIYNNGNGFKHTSQDLCAWWRMGDGPDSQYVIHDGGYMSQGVTPPIWDFGANVATSGIYNWLKTNSNNGLDNVSNKYRITYGTSGDKYGASVLLKEDADLTADLNIAHLYKITLTAQRTGIFVGDAETVIRVKSGHSSNPLSTYAVEGPVTVTEETRTVYFIAESETTAELGPADIKSADEAIDIDNLAITQYDGYMGLTINIGSGNFVKDSP